MTFEEYRTEGRVRYAAFVDAIRHILGAGADAHKLVPHAITGRAKAPKSLLKKLEDRKIDPDSNIAAALKDLAGARIVFLTNRQVNRFNQARIIHENFEVLDVNVHHPVPGTETEGKLFDSTNYLVCLKSERLALPEYKAFDGLRAEIQVQTLLDHAWAEMGHDTIYKQPKLQHVGHKRFDEIKARMDKVMHNHLRPAGYEFDKIARDFHLLLEADTLYKGTVATLETSRDNQALDEAIGALDDRILPQFEDRRDAFIKLLPTLVDVVTRTRGSDSAQLEAALGSYPGASGLDIARKVARLFGDHLYCDPALSFTTLLQLHGASVAPDERAIWIELATTFSKHDLAIWKKHGPAVPHLILSEIAKLPAPERFAARSILAPMLGNILSAELGGTTATSMTVQILQGAVPVSDVLRDLRTQAIDVLEAMLDMASVDADRSEILRALRHAGSTPYNGGQDALIGMIMTDAARYIGIECARAAHWGLELRRASEVSAIHLHNRFRALPPHFQGNAELEDAHRAVADALLALRDHLNADADYGIYKVLVGHDSVRPDAWSQQPFDIDGTAAWRSFRFAAIHEEISEDTVAEWIDRMRRYIAEPKATGGELQPMAECLKLLGTQKPVLAARFLDVMDDTLYPLLIALLVGINASSQPAAAEVHIAAWISNGRFLPDLAEYSRWQEPFDLDMLVAVTKSAIQAGDDDAAVSAINTAVERYSKAADRRLIDAVIMPAIGRLSQARKPQWVRNAWGFHRSPIIAELDESQSDFLLLSFVGLPEIDYLAETILASVADRFPYLVMKFFENRIDEAESGYGTRVHAVPSPIDRLKEPLSREPVQLLTKARIWHQKNPQYHEYQGGRLLRNVFPDLTPEIVNPLVKLIREGERQTLRFTLATLLAYDGKTQIYPLCMEVVDRLEEGDPLLKEVTFVLSKTGIVRGEYGFVDAGLAQRKQLEQWREDPRMRVRAFVDEQIRKVSQSMAWEQRQASHDIEQRKREWGAPDGAG